MDTVSAGALDKPSKPRNTSSSRHLTRGILKLDFAEEDGLLFVKVDRAHRLASLPKEERRVFVKMEIRYGSQPEQTQKTRSVSLAASPHFSETFQFYFAERNLKSRLHIETWITDETSRRASMVGCMSFGLQHLLTKLENGCVATSGWYYILEGSLGARKHVYAGTTEQEMTPRQAPTGTCFKNSQDVFEKQNKQRPSSMNHTIVLRHCPAGYGFTLQGSCPAKIATVKPHGAAVLSGLQSGDIVLKVNGEDVTSSSSGDVAQRVRYAPHRQVVLEVQRESHLMDTCSPKHTRADELSIKEDFYESLLSPRVSCLTKAWRTKPRKQRGTSPDRKVSKTKVKTKRGLGCGMVRTYRVQPRGQKFPADDVTSKENRPPALVKASPHRRLEYGRSASDSSSSSSIVTDVTKNNVQLGVINKNSSEFTPCSSLMSRSSCFPSSSQSRLPRVPKDVSLSLVHEWLNSVDQESDMTRKDGGYSNSGSSPENSLQTNSDNSAQEGDSRLTASNDVTKATCFSRSSGVSKTKISSSNHSPFQDRLSPKQTSTCHVTSGDGLRWDPGISVINQSRDSHNFCDSAEISFSEPVYSELDIAFNASESDDDFNDDGDDHDNNLLDCRHNNTLVSNNISKDDEPRDVTYAATLQSFSVWPPEVSAYEEEQYVDNRSFVKNVASYILDLEEKHVQFMQWGMGRFSRPLRHAILTPSQHSTIFQNIEKLVALSEYHHRQLLLDLEQENLTLSLNTYRSGLKTLCEAYNTYMSGLESAKKLLHDMERDNLQLVEFLGWWPEDGAQWCSLQTFISQPVKHLQHLLAAFEAVYSSAFADGCGTHQDSLNHMIKDLRMLANKWSDVMDTTFDLHTTDVKDHAVRNSGKDWSFTRHLEKIYKD